MEAIKYALRGVSIEQFATVFEPASDNIQFLEQDRPFLIAEVLCHFIIDEDSWNGITDNKTKDAVLPKIIVNNLARIAISTLRGSLCAKTENSPYSKFFLPLIDMPDEQGEDLIIIAR